MSPTPAVHPLLAWLYEIAQGVGGYLGIFVVSILGNLIPFFPIPYLAVVYFYGALIPGANPLLVGTISGFGASLGKMIIFLSSKYSREVVLSRETAERYEKLGKIVGNYGALGVFLFAATPSPDDAVIIPLGLMNYSSAKFFVAVLLGKIVVSTATVAAGVFVSHLGVDVVEGFLYSLVLFIIVMAAMYYIDWEKMLATIGEEGFSGFLRKVRTEGFSQFIARKGLKARKTD
uniref:VTT domain-containing protein n=1 Tax=Thermofilum pendens TaxID=2269 RepID=A0A7J3X5V2_THEPE